MSLPELLSKNQVAELLGITAYKVDALRKSGRLGFIKFGGKTIRFPLPAVQQYIEDNTVMPCQDHTQGQSSKLTNGATASMKSTTLMKRGADGNKALGQQILDKLKSRSKISSGSRTDNTAGRVIPVSFQ